MREYWAAGIVLLLVLASAAVGMLLQGALRERHRSRETTDAVRLVISILVTFTALVLGLVTSSVKSSYDQFDGRLRGYASDLTELDQRMRWKSEKSYVVSREELDQQGTTDLANAIRYSVTGGRYGGTLSHAMPDGCVIINGDHALKDWPLTAFFADEVEAVEVYPPKTDVTGSLEVRGCDPKKQIYVIWTRANSKRFPPNP